MSKQRQRDRAAREAAAAAQAAREAEAETRTPGHSMINAVLPAVKAKGKRGKSGVDHQGGQARPDARKAPPASTSARSTRASRPVVYRSRRFPPLPWRLKLALALGWSTAAVLTLYLVPTWTGRLGFLVVATFALPLIVVLVHDPSRRTR